MQARRRKIVGYLLVVAAVFWVLGAIFIPAWIIYATKLGLKVSRRRAIIGFGVAGVILLAIPAGYLWRLGRRLLKNSYSVKHRLTKDLGQSEIPPISKIIGDSRRPILYLRSFADDADIIPQHTQAGFLTVNTESFSQTTEEFLVKKLRKAGPVVAIGNPRDTLPELGAIRLYVDNEIWQKAIDQWLSECLIVVLRAGESPGLTWEFKTVLNNVQADRMILAFPTPLQYPPVSTFRAYIYCLKRLSGKPSNHPIDRSREDAYQRFRKVVCPYFPQPLPEKIGEALWVYFTDSMEPTPLLRFDNRLPASGFTSLVPAVEKTVLRCDKAFDRRRYVRQHGLFAGVRPETKLAIATTILLIVIGVSLWVALH